MQFGRSETGVGECAFVYDSVGAVLVPPLSNSFNGWHYAPSYQGQVQHLR